MRIIVTGGRTYMDRDVVYATLDAIHTEPPISCVVHGLASGADLLADDWATDREVAVQRFPADWAKHGRAAGPLRNQAMIDAGADLLVAFPGGIGTADCMRRARAAGIPVREILP